ncbi:fumarylacetoacetate hydrolase family protein [Nocardia sp. NPDC056952]|uniref:fumarylacetoacetate hydrolase family protein n=1 Tax=Nocardia sp. NPDC056952 TaxID=3345979 RepID=UPI003638F058
MKLRRVRTEDGLQTQCLRDGQWSAHPEPLAGKVFGDQWELGVANGHLSESELLLPFNPASFRDFMLFEQHNIDASRGLVRRFHPAQYRLAAAVERLSGRSFPLFKPKPLFYQQPIYYMGNHLTFVPSGTPISAPAYSSALDYELEIGFVLAEPLYCATAQQATAAIGAFVLLNDFSARDIQRAEMASGFGPQKSKHFASSMSATAVTADEILPRIDSLTGSVRINGDTVTTVSSAGMCWSLGEVLAHASHSEHLFAGELFGTGTLPGGSGMETGNWLEPGDVLTLTLDDIGEVEHHITS